MLKAKDIMTKEVINVKKDAPIFEAVKLLAKNEITATTKRIIRDSLLTGIGLCLGFKISTSLCHLFFRCKIF